MPKEYNGHHCWNCWNVALWIGNDEGLYRAALECVQRPRADGKPATSQQAARRFEREVYGLNERTPDGGRYTRTAVKAALDGLREDMRPTTVDERKAVGEDLAGLGFTVRA